MLTDQEKLLQLRLLWRGSNDTVGYAHSSLVLAACRLLNPQPSSWKSKNLWGVFYDEDELHAKITADPELCRIFREGYGWAERVRKNDNEHKECIIQV